MSNIISIIQFLLCIHTNDLFLLPPPLVFYSEFTILGGLMDFLDTFLRGVMDFLEPSQKVHVCRIIYGLLFCPARE